MDFMMVLASADENWAKPIIFGVIYVLFGAILFPMICMKLTKPKAVKEQLKKKKKCTVKTKARVTDLYGTMPAEFRGNSEAWSGGDRTIARYEYSVNGVRYTGSDEIFSSLGVVGNTIDVLYDPKDPSSRQCHLEGGQGTYSRTDHNPDCLLDPGSHFKYNTPKRDDARGEIRTGGVRHGGIRRCKMSI